MDDIRDRDALIEALRTGQRVKYAFFWGHETRPTLGAECLSQWYPVEFEVAGHTYASTEHFMMAEKARLFGDEDAVNQILAARHPGEAKRLGRKVRGFDEPTWVSARFDIVVRGNLAKFGQTEELAAFLARTGQRILVEASPVDRIWGIGMAGDHPHAEQPEKWKGLNLLGFALMEVRARLSE